MRINAYWEKFGGRVRRMLLVTLAIFIAVLFVGSGQKSGDQKLNLQQELNLAIMNLTDHSKIIRRQGAEKISLLIEVPGIQRAINPLADVLLNKSIPSGVFTQEICALNLGRIAAHLGGPSGDRAISFLAESLMTEKFDIVRSASAEALGLTNSEKAVPYLQDASTHDSSPLVKSAATEALNRLSRNGIDISSGSAQSLAAKSAAQQEDDEQILYEYLKSRIIAVNPPIDWQGGGR